MAGTFTNAGEAAILNYVMKGTAIASAGTLWMALWTADPTEAGSGGVEIAGTGYSRAPIPSAKFNAATAGSITTNGEVQFNSGATVGTWNGGSAIPGFAIFNSETAGGTNVMLAAGTLDDTSKVVTSGDTASFATGAISLTLD